MSQTTSTALPYDVCFYDSQRDGSRKSGRLVLEELFCFLQPKSVVDVGCGEGYWLSEAKQLGVNNILGLDGEYVNKDRLAIPASEFIATDLSKPFRLDRRFDLAMSLEVAEHLSESSAEAFVESLTTLSPAILFSAAIPGQGGTDHRNEQWPSYWATLFRGHGFLCFDVIRPRIWNDERIEFWYRQNTFLFLSETHPLAKDGLVEKFKYEKPMDAMHYELVKIVNDRSGWQVQSASHPGISKSCRLLLAALRRRFKF